MRYIEWGFLFLLSGLGIGLANLVGFQVNFLDSLPGILILLAISCVGVVVSKLIPLKLPIVAYVSILGLLAASPISPARQFVIDAVGKINFTAPLTRCVCRNFHRRPGKNLRKTGMENDSDRRLCYDRNLYRFRCDCTGCHDADRNDLNTTQEKRSPALPRQKMG